MEIKLCDILEQKKIITPEHFQEAKESAFQKGGSVIGHLIDLGFLSEDTLINFLREKYKCVYFDLANYNVKEEIIKRIPINVAKRFLLIPIANSSNILAVSMVDPISEEIIRVLQQLTDYYILPFMSRKKDIERVIYYHEGASSKSVKESVEETLSTQKGLPLVKKFVFDSFVTGTGNNFTYAIAMAVAKFPGGKYNPLFIYSKTGLGKTHLINAIGNYLTVNVPSMKIFYTNTEQFIGDIVSAIKNNTVNEFRNMYRNNDVLLIDDIHFLIGKERAQEEFFHTFNALAQTDKQIVVTSDRPPTEFKNIEERLRTRLAGGIITDIQPPDLETRVAILKKKLGLRESEIEIPDEVIFFLAQSFSDSVRELEGALNKVLLTFQLKLKGEKITVEGIKEVLKDILISKKMTAKEEGYSLSLKKRDLEMAKTFKQKIKQARNQQEIIKVIKETIDFLSPVGNEKQNWEVINTLNEVKKLLGEENLQKAFELITKLQNMKI